MNKIKWLVLAIMIISPISYVIGQQLILTPSNFNGYNVSCFGGQNGSIDLTITGGTTPYTILWSNTATTEDISNLRAGYYRVTVDDADSQTPPVMAEITLTEPQTININAVSYQYPNNYNISLYGACNGSIDVTASNGVSPYSYLWNDGILTQDRASLCSNSYKITITDNNGCTKISESISLSQPDRSDWQMVGNSGTNPNNNFIGTSDNIDLVFKTNSLERMRITNSGELNISSLAGTGNRYLQANQNGKLQIAPGVPWETHGNDNINDQVDFIGTINSADFIIKTASAPRLYVKSNGLIGIGISNPVRNFEVNGFSRFGDLDNGEFVEAGFDNVTNYFGLDSYGLPNGLRINYNSGENVQILTNTSGGSFEVGHNVLLSTIDGSVSIGTTNTQNGYKLLVEGGKSGFREVYVKLTGQWPDYVFDNKYNLLSLKIIESHIKINKSLPGMPNGNDIDKNGLEIGEIIRLQQEKIEELYLHVINLEKEIQLLKNNNSR
jgi:hypothetical protein